MSQVSETINSRWKETCGILLKGEIGGMREYEGWLSRSIRIPSMKVSSISGKPVTFVYPFLDAKSKAISLEEADYSKKFSPLGINDIKDIDSILESVQERFVYCGNLYLGKSANIENSTDVFDSFYISDSTQVSYSKYIAYCHNMEYNEYTFGCQNHGNSKYCINVYSVGFGNRCLEISNCNTVSDCYFSHGLRGSNDCMFCFNLRNKSNMIGNIQLTKDMYGQLKTKLLSEMREILKSKKSLPSLEDLIAGQKTDVEKARSLVSGTKAARTQEDISPIEKAFSDTSSLLLGKALFGIENYSAWLLEHTAKKKECKSCISSSRLDVYDYANYLGFPENRLVSDCESESLGELKPKGEVDGIGFSGMGKVLGQIAFYSPSFKIGECFNNIKSELTLDSTNTYCSALNLCSKNIAKNYYILESEAIFGSNSIRRSKYCINCYFSANLSRCFECDSCRSCEGCYFCHNVENCSDCMFCFNVKAKRYAIGNVQYSKEEYMRIKKLVLAELSTKLEKDKEFGVSIYNMGSKN